MKRYLLTCSMVVLVLSVVLSGLALAQGTGQIIVNGVPDRFKSANQNQWTTSLKAVGLGSRVVLSPRVLSGTGTKYSDTLVAVTSASWTLTDPSGNARSIQDTADGLNGKVVYFVPDTVGNWTVSMTATTVLGTTTSVSATIISAKYVGAGISLSASGPPTGCACHFTDPTTFTDWQKTNHAQAVKRKTTQTGGHFSFSCFPCHSIGYDRVSGGSNGGFDDMAPTESFTTVPTNAPGVFDTLVAKYPKSMALTGIQCENCHGPASLHQTSGLPTPGNTKLDHSLSPDVCAPCHFSSDRHGIGYAWTGSAHANSLKEGSQVEYLDRPICSKCHTGQGYIEQTIKGNPEPVVASGQKVYTNPQPIGCAVCHDPHKNNNPSSLNADGSYAFPQLRVSAVADACMGCHITRISSRGLHSAHQGSMLLGANSTPFTLQNVNNYLANSSLAANAVGAWGGWELPGYTYENSSHSNIAERCVTCHMASSPSFLASQASNFSIPDTMLNRLGGHTFNVAYSFIRPTDTLTVLNPTGCVECHGKEVGIEFVELTQAKTKTLLNTLKSLLPRRDSLVAVSVPTDTMTYQNWKNSATYGFPKRKLTVTERAAAYNYFFVNNDNSFGVHNFNYAKGLLTSSIEQLQLGAGAANIVQIKDVPGDNGKSVQIVWNQFPSEKFSINRLGQYGIWRRDPLLPATSSALKKAGSYTEMIQAGVPGSQYVVAGNVWTYVGYIPASNFTQYSYIAPTIFDSTKVAGMKYTAFYVCGYTSDPTVVYASAIDSGYSLNNLIPLAPAGFTASSSSQGVDLKWDPPTPMDNDIEKYVVYRSTTANFDPTGTQPIATVDRALMYRDAGVQQGGTYYYKIAAIDNAGNQGGYSNEISLKVTSVVELGGLPTEFALSQNYPNPFNPTTQVHFALPQTATVKLQIYSVSGVVVATLMDGEMPAGNYSVTWNGLSTTGATVSSGVYLYRIQAGEFVAVRKMIMLK